VRRVLLAVSLLAALGPLLGASACIKKGGPLPAEEDWSAASVKLLPSERHQTLEGFGASVAFYIELAVGPRGAPFYRTLFSDLGLDVLRLRNRYQRTDAKDANLEQEVELVRHATESLGHPPKIMLSSWSPPAALKANAAEKCAGNEDCTLRRDGGRFVYEAFGDYWRDSLAYYASLGIVPDYVTIQNEPDFIPPSWEGCKFEPSETAKFPGFDRALEAVHASLAGLASPPKILAPEVLGVHYERAEKYAAPMNFDLVYGLAHHLYERGDDGIWDWRSPGPDSYVKHMQGAASAAHGKPVFQTEFQTDDDNGTEGGFETAWLIHDSLVDEGVVAFLYWDLVWTADHGLVSVEGGRVHLRDQYYSLRHYARFTDPGDVRIGATASRPDIRVSAFESPGGDRVTVVVLNTGSRSIDVHLDAGGFAGQRVAAYRTTYRPGESETWADLAAEGGPADVVSLPPRSIATVVLKVRG
jgi:glucuronoarabinoxylan endo-1,4-beta-xylanase